jgi:outer membrane protein assembly factor BamE (lipoprotein component of BamABCDE complex)
MKLVFITLLFALVSCATHKSVTNKMKLGMDRAEVEKLLGEPETTKAAGGATYLTYKLSESSFRPHITEPYVFVFDKDNKLVQFGHLRDFRDEATVNVVHQN